uniref:Uncharacterized protein At2g29880 family n=1 Tax=Cajanus cajan TaxID=3821 RepID=A0A151RVX4_CAJCA|nr:Uncharacterized protein At2g29880 family [Cajanus cajan]
MGDSQGNNKGKKENHEVWIKEDSNELLQLIVDAIKSGLCDANRSISKLNVERVILPRLNAKIKFPKTYNHYLSQIKWFKKQYNNMLTLMHNNCGFGWDPITKTFTASDEVWKYYLKIRLLHNLLNILIVYISALYYFQYFNNGFFFKSHPSHKNLREKSMINYEDLKIVIGGGTPSEHTSMLVDPDDTDATTFGEENVDFRIENFSYDLNSDIFIAPYHYEPPYQPPSYSLNNNNNNNNYYYYYIIYIAYVISQSNDTENEKELFNLRHISLMNVIERIFDIFKLMFIIFKSTPIFLFKTQVELVLAYAILHNFLHKKYHFDEFSIEPVDEPSSSIL